MKNVVEVGLLEWDEPQTDLLPPGSAWRHAPSSPADAWLRSMVIGTCLNVCCGDSTVGDVRVDLSPNAKGRTEEGDLFHLRFPRGSFGTVVCDPPFSYYGAGFRWIRVLTMIARNRLLLSSPAKQIILKRSVWETRLFAILGGQGFLRLYWVFDRKMGILGEDGRADPAIAQVSPVRPYGTRTLEADFGGGP